jgi:hypothetical protein
MHPATEYGTYGEVSWNKIRSRLQHALSAFVSMFEPLSWRFTLVGHLTGHGELVGWKASCSCCFPHMCSALHHDIYLIEGADDASPGSCDSESDRDPLAHCRLSLQEVGQDV